MMEHFTNYNFESRTASQQSQVIKSVQAWKKDKIDNSSPIKQDIIQTLNKASREEQPKFDTVLAYTNSDSSADYQPKDNKENNYKFEDVIDIINPLHHLPIIGMVYRGITGDEIKPASQIIGGALFGGPVGAVTGTANAISEIQTGKDLAGNVMAIAGIGDKNRPDLTQDHPVNRLNHFAEENSIDPELPGTVLSFVNLSEPNNSYQKIKVANGRTAGSMIVKTQMTTQYYNNQPVPEIETVIHDHDIPKKEVITSLSLSPLPPPFTNI